MLCRDQAAAGSQIKSVRFGREETGEKKKEKKSTLWEVDPTLIGREMDQHVALHGARELVARVFPVKGRWARAFL